MEGLRRHKTPFRIGNISKRNEKEHKKNSLIIRLEYKPGAVALHPKYTHKTV